MKALYGLIFYKLMWLNKKGYFTGLEVVGNDYVNHPTHWRPIETI